jgi:hypothetical protein
MSDLALEPGWYSDPYGEQIERYHDGSRWTGRIRVPGSPEELVQAEAKPISGGLRTLATVVGCLAVFGWNFASTWVYLFVRAVPGLLMGYAFLLAWVLVVILVGRKVQVSGFWAVAPVVPFLGGFATIYATRILVSRLVYLPYRDWDMTAVDQREWLQMRDPTKEGETILMRRRG